MISTRISSARHPLAAAWWQLYESAFPASERRDAAQHAAALRHPAFHCLHLADDRGMVGLLGYWLWDSLCYVEHFAVVPERRGQGLGHRVLAQIPQPVILEIEPVVDETTSRRLAFYKSCGYQQLPQPHVQLAYQAEQPNVPLVLLSCPALDATAVARFEELYASGPMSFRTHVTGFARA